MAGNNPSSNVQYLRDATGRHITGAIVDGWLVKVVEGSKHMLRRYPGPGWATDAATLTIARTLGAVGVRVEDRETGRVYRASMATLDAHGVRFNRGYGEQIALHMKHWQLQGAPTAAEAPPVQAALFAA
jgi:hypothetical protein